MVRDVCSRNFPENALANHPARAPFAITKGRSEEHTSELQSHSDLVCRLLLVKKNFPNTINQPHRLNAVPAARNCGKSNSISLDPLWSADRIALSRTASAVSPRIRQRTTVQTD